MTKSDVRTLYIHIGSHKTGTTSIQYNLAANEEVLRENGLHYFYSTPEGRLAQFPMFHPWLVWAPEKSIVPNGMRVSNPALLTERLSKTQGDVIISSENFSFFFLPERIQELYDAVRPIFENIKIICYLRRQDLHAISHAREGAQLNRGPEAALWGHPLKVLPQHVERFDLYLDYATRIGRWADIFGDESLIIKVFDSKEMVNGDVVDDFCSVIGLPSYRKTPQMNISKSSDEAKFSHLILRGDFQNTQKLLDLNAKLPRSKENRAPSRHAAKEFYGYYRDGNIALNERFHVNAEESLFKEDFSAYPELSTEKWTEQETARLLRRLLQLHDKTLSLLSPEECRRVAAALQETQPELAAKMLDVAKHLT